MPILVGMLVQSGLPQPAGKADGAMQSLGTLRTGFPLLAEAGEVVEEVELELELQLLADVAVIGVPNAGKSSFLQACSRARPDIAGYPFTTLEPVLGFVERRGKEFVVVEIPGLLEGAHTGVGLGDDFLRHMGRTRGVIHLLDGASDDPLRDYRQVREEMRLYDPALGRVAGDSGLE